MKDFITAMKDTNNVSVTENGAIGYATTYKPLLDMHFALSSMRNMDADAILQLWIPAFMADPIMALRWLFYIRDIREGLGERRTFRIILKWLAKNETRLTMNLITWRSSFTLNNGPLVAYYGRWDDLLALFSTPLEEAAINIISHQLYQDVNAMNEGKPVSLAAKWCPSINAGKAAHVNAEKIRKLMRLTPKEYKHLLSELRKYLDVLEVKASANQWDEIKYSTVPSIANLRYSKAFLRHDYARRCEYLEKLTKGEETVNASVAFPYQIYHKLEVQTRITYHGYNSPEIVPYSDISEAEAQLLNAMWKSLPDVTGDTDTLVVCDSSGSMQRSIDRKSDVEAIDVAESLAIYFAERMHGRFANTFITFSNEPKIVEIPDNLTLLEKALLVRSHVDYNNTDIAKVFKLILDTAINNSYTQEDLPKNILIISDMEFDYVAFSVEGSYMIKTFDALRELYESNGYKMPKLIFWNVCSRTMTIPVKENENGVSLVSGFSVNTAKMVMSSELDPYKALINELMNPRYQVVEDAIKGGFNIPCENDNQFQCNECTKCDPSHR